MLFVKEWIAVFTEEKLGDELVYNVLHFWPRDDSLQSDALRDEREVSFIKQYGTTWAMYAHNCDDDDELEYISNTHCISTLRSSGPYQISMGMKPYIPPHILKQNADYALALFEFLLGPPTAHRPRDQVVEVAAVLGKHFAAQALHLYRFANLVPHTPLPPHKVMVFNMASQLVRKTAFQVPHVIGSAVFYGGSVFYTQFNPGLTELLITGVAAHLAPMDIPPDGVSIVWPCYIPPQVRRELMTRETTLRREFGEDHLDLLGLLGLQPESTASPKSSLPPAMFSDTDTEADGDSSLGTPITNDFTADPAAAGLLQTPRPTEELESLDFAASIQRTPLASVPESDDMADAESSSHARAETLCSFADGADEHESQHDAPVDMFDMCDTMDDMQDVFVHCRGPLVFVCVAAKGAFADLTPASMSVSAGKIFPSLLQNLKNIVPDAPPFPIVEPDIGVNEIPVHSDDNRQPLRPDVLLFTTEKLTGEISGNLDPCMTPLRGAAPFECQFSLNSMQSVDELTANPALSHIVQRSSIGRVNGHRINGQMVHTFTPYSSDRVDSGMGAAHDACYYIGGTLSLI
ncbi:hypothetical protein J8273_0418 [Carpediemonas membranifera]|uniref:Uncharacterized protein n=1 Tax=Carpediemonas membranifera TaxID=201153 RepID=A0A8J6E2X0_9EUKA|nr:hypothetical protein J8273_0418 [Carpediemonas membranifera]|eukprot:KAG9395198.1 hypothetical protein J8273_0418 [Carpediemonas membranifera]